MNTLENAYNDVHDFHVTFDHPHSDKPRLQPVERVTARTRWIEEEITELREATTIYEQADAYLDIIYFAIGGLVDMGVEPSALWNLVHDANMAKVWPDGTVHRREDGKIVKPDGWKAPDEAIAEEINRRMGLDNPASQTTLEEPEMKKTINRITREDIRDAKIVFSNFNTETNINALDFYQNIATKSAIYPGQNTPLGLAYVALKLNGEAGEFAEHVGKAMRDDGLIPIGGEFGGYQHDMAHLTATLTPERRTLIIKEIGDVLWYLSAACNELGITLSEAALTNLEKLCDRGERDVLHGSDDNR